MNIENTKLYFAKIKSDAIIPTKREEDGGFDIYSCFEEDFIRIKPNEIKKIPTGIACAFSKDYVMIGKERGSTGFNGLSIRAGVIDSGFRNEIQILINNTTDKMIYITKDEDKAIEAEVQRWVKKWNYKPPKKDAKKNCVFYPYKKAIAQVIMLINPKLEVEELTYENLQKIESERGMGMLGSTGK